MATEGEEVGTALTFAYLSIVGHDDQLHILGRGLRVAFVLRKKKKGADGE